MVRSKGLKRTQEEIEAKRRAASGGGGGEPAGAVAMGPAGNTEEAPASMAGSKGLKRTKEEIEAKRRAVSGSRGGGKPAGAAAIAGGGPVAYKRDGGGQGSISSSQPVAHNAARSSELKTTGLHRTQQDIEAKRKISFGGGAGGGGNRCAKTHTGGGNAARGVAVVVKVPSKQAENRGLRNSKTDIEAKQMAFDDPGSKGNKGAQANVKRTTAGITKTNNTQQKPTLPEFSKEHTDNIPASRLSAIRYLESTNSLPDIQPLPEPDADNMEGMDESQAGAYSESLSTPGPERLDHIRYSLVGVEPQLLSTAVMKDQPTAENDEQTTIPPAANIGSSPPSTSHMSEMDLAQATLVHEKSILDIDLEPVDMDEAERKKAKKEQQRKLFIAISVILLTMALIIVLGSIFGLRSKNSASQSNQSPTVAPSFSPSDSPSAAPTGVLDSMRAILPNYTLESLDDPFSPQSLAFDWLLNHQNIPNLEEWRKLQLFALATIYFSFDGPNWRNGLNEDWLDDARSECLWFSSWALAWGDVSGAFLGNQGNSSCNEAGEFQVLNLQQAFNLGDQRIRFPREIALLTNLVEIDLTRVGLNVSLSEDIVPVMSLLQNLKSFRLISNSITGTIPKELGSWTKLTYLGISDNYLSGTVPTEVALMTGLESISLSWNGLSGPIPSELARLSNLYELILFDCGLSGRIPSELGSLSNLMYLYLEDNRLTGSIPPQVASMTGLQSLWLSYNDLTEQIPSQLGLMAGLTYLTLDHNSLTGSMPREVSLLRNLTGLYLTNNHLTGTLSTELGLMKYMDVLGLGNNLLSGLLPPELGKLTGATRIDLNANAFSGFIPTELGLAAALQDVRLNDNGLSGHIPSELGSLTSLRRLYLNGNNLSGEIPSSWMSLDFNSSNKPDFDLTEVEHFYLLGAFWEPDYIHTLDLRDNPLLAGLVPEELCLMNTLACSVDYNDSQWTSQPCSLDFNCTGILCGCDCSCQIGNETNKGPEAP